MCIYHYYNDQHTNYNPEQDCALLSLVDMCLLARPNFGFSCSTLLRLHRFFLPSFISLSSLFGGLGKHINHLPAVVKAAVCARSVGHAAHLAI